MTHMTVTIDGEKVIDGDLGEWNSNPPEILRDQLAANATPKPWMRCLLMVIADTAMSGVDTAVVIATSQSGWTLEVTGP